jgi:hypothetical protein
MIRVTCPNCKSTLNAEDQLAGQTRKCPRCGQPVLIPEPGTPPQPVTQDDGGGSDLEDVPLRRVIVPDRLQRANHYLICDTAKLVAGWKNDGRGWMLKTNAGMISALRNRDQIPNQGNFTLVELKLAESEAGHRLAGITSYQLSRWALTMLDRDESRILSAVTGPGSLNKQQKSAVRQLIQEEFIYDVWKDARQVLEYLGNTDYHSPGTE